VKKVLLLAYHFPPQSGSSGLLRSLKFARYLPESDWEPIVLTVNSRAYERLDSGQMTEIPYQVPVYRTFALDARRHLSWQGRYSRVMALPDRWSSWCLSAVPIGLRLIRKHRVDVILSTYPIASAILIGLLLHRMSGTAWVIDFRDSMTEASYPREPLTWKSYRWIEQQAIRRGSRFLFTASSTRLMYLNRYPGLKPERCLLIPNGYDEEDFRTLAVVEPFARLDGRPVRLLHAGLVYPEERDPTAFFRCLSRLSKEERISSNEIRIEFRGAGSEDYYEGILKELEIQDLVHLLPPLPYHQNLKDCAEADALMLLQAASCNHQIPAKAYEYLRLGKPILALTHSKGDTATLLREVGGATIVDLANEDDIYAEIPKFLDQLRSRRLALPDPSLVQHFERRQQAHRLAECLSNLVKEKLADQNLNDRRQKSP
jgi:glycosyltransferase involved in cell wall biosynthesis